jgi:hypothetical protein
VGKRAKNKFLLNFLAFRWFINFLTQKINMKLLQTKGMHIFFNVDPTSFLEGLLNLNSQPAVENAKGNIALESFKFFGAGKKAIKPK